MTYNTAFTIITCSDVNLPNYIIVNNDGRYGHIFNAVEFRTSMLQEYKEHGDDVNVVSVPFDLYARIAICVDGERARNVLRWTLNRVKVRIEEEFKLQCKLEAELIREEQSEQRWVRRVQAAYYNLKEPVNNIVMFK